MTKIAIIVYTLYGHIGTLAESVKKGVESTGAECTIFQVPETLTEDVLGKMHAPPKPDYPIMTAAKMEEFDSFMFGLSGRFGIMPAQMKSFMDSTGSLWMGGKLVGKTGGCFFSTGCQGGGQETMGIATVTFLSHHGMVFIPLGYVDPKVMSIDEVHGASAYGSGTIAGGDGSRQPSTLEKDVGESHGKHFATIAAKLAK